MPEAEVGWNIARAEVLGFWTGSSVTPDGGKGNTGAGA